ncbi:MAG: PhzF family phenazine biosynthesis protein [Syntrophomonadaceae bacterium]|nr:PhzF family phenazine biosynthesis protein [Syntrophomonadaceae bacterium]
MFSPRYGYLGDPATGSGNSAFGLLSDRHVKTENVTIHTETGSHCRRIHV